MNQTQGTHWFSLFQVHRLATALFVATTALCPERAFARDQPPTTEEKEACIDDVFRLCSSHIPDRTAITACLRAKQANLSKQCRYVISVRDSDKGKVDSK
ncbi:hypothetical protein AS156_06695 [Bradyrhizobium macuxiense]|uniref:Cysteine rich repeat protein n=1 Tax=Bradyrhizobium macuxiense TaxID=1755647 RepID=A0A109JTE5_9BRAD|nr:hypothetical protein AS156_06695 [Bradyrhizobium macuxiense]